MNIKGLYAVKYLSKTNLTFKNATYSNLYSFSKKDSARKVEFYAVYDEECIHFLCFVPIAAVFFFPIHIL